MLLTTYLIVICKQPPQIVKINTQQPYFFRMSLLHGICTVFTWLSSHVPSFIMSIIYNIFDSSHVPKFT